LVHPCQTSPLLPGPHPTMASAILILLYSLLYGEHIKDIQVLGFLPFPYLSHEGSPLRVWPMSTNISTFILGL
jgi:hypothetical protein